MDRMKRISAILCVLVLAAAMLLAGCGSSTDAAAAVEQPVLTEAESAGDGAYVYLAGPFFNETEVANIEYAESVLEKNGFSYFSPMRHDVDEEHGTPEWADKIFEMDRREIEKADFVVAIYYGSYSDTGTAWECGYATAIGKPVILVHAEEDGDSNLMLHSSSATNIYLDELETYDFKNMPSYEYDGEMN